MSTMAPVTISLRNESRKSSKILDICYVIQKDLLRNTSPQNSKILDRCYVTIFIQKVKMYRSNFTVTDDDDDI